MSRDELKEEITRVLETVPEDVLEDLLDYLKLLVNNPKDKLLMTKNLRQIISEDEELLQKLAQ
jgi:hypothetical protein